MNYFQLDLQLPQSLKQQLIQEAISNDSFYEHNSTVSGTYTNLQFLERSCDQIESMFKHKPYGTALCKIEPNKLVDWHTDNSTIRRGVIIFPLSNHYAPCTTERGNIPLMDCYVFNTQLKHKVSNNNYTRISVQLFYNDSIEDLFRMHCERELVNE